MSIQQYLKSLIFNYKLIRFLSNTKEIGKFEVGIFDYENSREPIVCNFSTCS